MSASTIVTQYRVQPTGYADAVNSDRHVWCVTVELTDEDRGRWAVRRLGEVLSRKGEWDYEPMPSSRSEKWLKGHRFTLGEALVEARGVVNELRVNGRTLAEASARVAARWADAP